MKKLNKLKGVDERLLFHGTSPSHVSAICEQNFDWRLCGTHGTMYGKGTSAEGCRGWSSRGCTPQPGWEMWVRLMVSDPCTPAIRALSPVCICIASGSTHSNPIPGRAKNTSLCLRYLLVDRWDWEVDGKM